MTNESEASRNLEINSLSVSEQTDVIDQTDVNKLETKTKENQIEVVQAGKSVLKVLILLEVWEKHWIWI